MLQRLASQFALTGPKFWERILQLSKSPQLLLWFFPTSAGHSGRLQGHPHNCPFQRLAVRPRKWANMGRLAVNRIATCAMQLAGLSMLPYSSSVATLKKYCWWPSNLPPSQELYFSWKLLGLSSPFAQPSSGPQIGFTDRNSISPGGGTTGKHKTPEKILRATWAVSLDPMTKHGQGKKHISLLLFPNNQCGYIQT